MTYNLRQFIGRTGYIGDGYIRTVYRHIHPYAWRFSYIKYIPRINVPLCTRFLFHKGTLQGLMCPYAWCSNESFRHFYHSHEAVGFHQPPPSPLSVGLSIFINIDGFDDGPFKWLSFSIKTCYICRQVVNPRFR